MLGFELDLFFYEACIWLGLGLWGFSFSCRRLLAGVYV
jgi:hypothetical protein